MADKTVNVRVKMKTDTSANWAKATSFVPLSGELIVYSDLNKIKIGDGTTGVTALPFLADKDTTYSAATTSAAGLMSSADKTKLDNISSAGSTTKPVYFSNGRPTEVGSSLAVSVTGNAATADTLKTSRTLSLTQGVTSTATSFNGSANINIPVTGVKEAYLAWGGKNFAGDYGPFDAALIPTLGANRLAGISANAVQIEFSTNGGSTWTTYNADDASKRSLFTTNTTLYLRGPNSSLQAKDITNYQLRITIDGVTANIYTTLLKFAIYISTNGNNNVKLKIERAEYSNPTTFIEQVKDVPLNGWSGWNIINEPLGGSGCFGGTDQNTHNKFLRFTFSAPGATTNTSQGLLVYCIYAYGGFGWSQPTNLSKYGTPYTYDYASNVTFDGNITSPNFYGTLQGNATGSAARLSNTTAIGGTTTPVYFNSSGVPVACSYTLSKSVPADAVFTDHTYSNFVKSGATAAAGLVPAPSTTAGATKYLCEDGTWAVPPDTNTTYTSLKNPYALTLQFNGVSQAAYDGSVTRTYNITPAAIGALGVGGNAVTATNISSRTPTLAAANESNAITVTEGTNGEYNTYFNGFYTLASITKGMNFNWYNTKFTVGSIRSDSTAVIGLGLAYNNTLRAFFNTYGTLTKRTGSDWIQARDVAVVRQEYGGGSSFYPVMSSKTANGEWSVGALGGSDNLYFSYGTDSNYSSSTNSTVKHFLYSGGASITGRVTISDTYYPKIIVTPTTNNSDGTKSKAYYEGGYDDKISFWIDSDATNDTKSRRGLVVYGWANKTNSSQAIALRQCDTSGTWLSDEYVYHTGNLKYYATINDRPATANEGDICLVKV